MLFRGQTFISQILSPYQRFLLKMGPLYSNLYNTEAPIVYTSGFLQYKNELGLDLKNDKRIVWEHVCTAACIN